MKLRCWIVFRMLAGLPPGTSLRASVSRHIARCERCRAEAAAYANLSAALRECAAGDEAYPFTWADVRAAVTAVQPNARAGRRHLVLAAGAVCAAVIVLATWLSLRHDRGAMPTVKPPTRVSLPGSTPNKAPKPKPEIIIPRPDSPTSLQAWAGWTRPKLQSGNNQKRPLRRPHRRSLPPHRSVPPPGPMIAKASPEAPQERRQKTSVTVVTPEEQVIGLVGINMDVRDEDSYVIKQVSLSDTSSTQL